MDPRNDLFTDSLLLRSPCVSDGHALNRLVAASPPLDRNSVYCNLLQCLHFSETSVAAELDGELVGFISAYIPPNEPDTLFVWQLVVAESARGTGVARRMLQWLVDQPACEPAQRLATTITADNRASWAVFEGFAARHQAALSRAILFQREQHFAGEHADEFLLQITPLPNRTCAKPMSHHLDSLRAGLRSPGGPRWLD